MKLSKKEELEISVQISRIEEKTGGKIAIHIDDYCKGDPYFKAEKLFRDLELLKHPDENAFLLYVALKDRQMAILGDHKIDQKIAENFYDQTLNNLKTDIKEIGLAHGIKNTLSVLEKEYQ